MKDPNPFIHIQESVVMIPDSYATEKDLIAFCGQYCRDCVYYKNTFGFRATDLLKEIKTYPWIEMAWESLDAPFDTKEFVEALTWVASSSGCLGCRAGAGWSECPIRICAQKMKVRGCFECDRYPCDMLLKEEASTQRESIEQIKNSGLDEYIKKKRGE
jgi:hypothetical protein